MAILTTFKTNCISVLTTFVPGRFCPAMVYEVSRMSNCCIPPNVWFTWCQEWLLEKQSFWSMPMCADHHTLSIFKLTYHLYCSEVLKVELTSPTCAEPTISEPPSREGELHAFLGGVRLLHCGDKAKCRQLSVSGRKKCPNQILMLSDARSQDVGKVLIRENFASRFLWNKKFYIWAKQREPLGQKQQTIKIQPSSEHIS